MTNEEAINVLEDYDINFERHTAEAIAEAHEMAIKALQEHQHYKDLAESYEKTINKLTKAIAEPQQKIGHWTHDGSSWKNRWICSECGYKLYAEQSKYCPDCGSYNGGARGDIPLQQNVPEMPQPSEHTETHACDCISREAVLDALHSCFAEGFNEDRWWNSTYVLDVINKVPSIQPQPKEEPQQKTGHWEWVQYESKPNFGNWHCSECRCILRGEIKENPIKLPKYCPECGARMEEEKK